MAPKVRLHLRRPAARAAVVRRRPAAVEAEEKDGVEAKSLLGDLSVAELSRLGHIWLQKAIYYGQEVDLVGKM